MRSQTHGRDRRGTSNTRETGEEGHPSPAKKGCAVHPCVHVCRCTFWSILFLESEKREEISVEFLPLLLLLLLYTSSFCLALRLSSHAPVVSLSFAHAGAHKCCMEMQILKEVVENVNENMSLPCVCYKTLIEKKLMIDPLFLCFNGKSGIYQG